MPELDDHELLRQYARDQSEVAFSTLVARYVNLVYSAALRFTHNPDDAEEITQAVFIILAQKAGNLGRGVVLSGWLYQTARLTAANFVKGEVRRQRREQEAYMQSTSAEPETADWEQIAPLLDEAMGQLGETDRNAVVLRFFEKRSAPEVAALLHIDELAARKRLNRAVDKLRKFFTKRGVVSTAAILAGAVSAHSVQAAPSALTNSIAAVAIPKGAAASGSTVTLVKGALKLMAWTKAKTAIGVGAIIILISVTGTVVLTTICSARVANYPNIQGAWEGLVHLDEGGVAAGTAASTHLVLKLTKISDGYIATTDWIEKGRKNVPMGKVVYGYPSLEMRRNPRETWKLKVNADATEMIWDHWIHFIQPDPVVLKRIATPDSVPERLTETDFLPRDGSDLQGYWKGEIKSEPDALPVSLKIAESVDGTFRAEGDSPMQGANGQPTIVIYKRPTVKFMLASGAGEFQGTINRDNTEISGLWTQEGRSGPAIVKRSDYQAEHAQDFVQSYVSVTKNELQGHWKGSWVVTIANVKATIRQTLDIARLPDGSYSARLANIDEFGHDDPIPPLAVSILTVELAYGMEMVRWRVRRETGRRENRWNLVTGRRRLSFDLRKSEVS